MKQLYRILIAYLLAVSMTDVAYAQFEDDGIIGGVEIDTFASFKDGCDHFNKGKDYYFQGYYYMSEQQLEQAVCCFEQHLNERPGNVNTMHLLGYSYYLLFYARNTETNKDHLEKAIQYLPIDATVPRLEMHYYYGQYWLWGDSLSGIERDYCKAFQEFEEAMAYDIDIETVHKNIPLYKSLYYSHAILLFDSYVNNLPDTINLCGDTKEIPAWDTCIGGQQLDRCIDDLNSLIGIGQEDSVKNIIDTMALALLGECYYYKKEYKKATDCFEQSGLSAERFYTIRRHEAVRIILVSYSEQKKDTCEQARSLTYTLVESYRNDYAIYHQIYRDMADHKLYRDNPNDKIVDDSWLRLVHDFLLYYFYLGETEKAFDFWLKIKNNFSLSPMLLMDQALIRINLGDFDAISDFAYAFNMMNQDGSLNNYLSTSSNKHTNDDEEDVFKTIKDAYFNFAISSFYIDSNYVEAKKYFRNSKEPEDILMTGICYKKLAKIESDPKTKTDYESLSRKKFHEVIIKEDSIGKISSTPYAYLFLNENDKAVETMERILKTDIPSSAVTLDDTITCYSLHYKAAEIYAKVGDLSKAKQHLDKAFEYFHEPILLAFALKMPLLNPIRDYVEKEVNRYKVSLGIAEPRIQDTIFICDIPFEKNKTDYTKTIKCRINDAKDETEMLFDPGADKSQLNKEDSEKIGITCDDIIGYMPFYHANGEKDVKPLVSLKKVKIGDIELENVQAAIDSSANAKSLLGCTVWNNLKVEMPSPVNKGMIRLTYIKESIEIPEDKKKLINNKANETLWQK